MTTAIFALLFLVLDAGKAMLRITGHNSKTMDVSIIHESIAAEATLCSLAGDGQTMLHVQDSESVTIVVREAGRVVASAVLDVDTGLAEKIGAIVVPVSVCNVIIDQREFGDMARALTTAVEQEAQVL